MARSGRSGRRTGVKKMGLFCYENPRFLIVVKDLLSTGYEWRTTREIREHAGIDLEDKEDNSLWHRFSRNGYNDGYFESKKVLSPVKNYYIRPADGSIDKLQDVVDWVNRQ